MLIPRSRVTMGVSHNVMTGVGSALPVLSAATRAYDVNDQLSIGGVMADNGLNGASPFGTTLWTTDLEDKATSQNGHNLDTLLTTAWYTHISRLSLAYLESARLAIENSRLVEACYCWQLGEVFRLTADIQYQNDDYQSAPGPTGWG